MKALRILALAATASAATALAAPDDAQPRVELPLGPYVRAGRPLDVRVVGGADRVRATGTPWALPQGERGDEFLLQPTQESVGRLELTIEKDGRSFAVVPTVSVLPETTSVRGVAVGRAGDASSKAGPGVVVEIPSAALPTVADAWRMLDAFDGLPVPRLAREVFGDDDAADVARQARALPALAAPLPEAFAATADAARRAPRLPPDVGAALAVLAAVELLLVVVLRLSRVPPWRRAAWLALPALATSGWLAAGERLPGALAAVALDVDGPDRTVFVRVEARRAGEAEFALPQGAGNAWIVRFAPDDRTVESVCAGRQVRMSLGAGESRVFCYAMPRRRGDESDARGTSPPSPPLLAFLAALRVLPDGDARLGFDASDLPGARGARVVAAVSVRCAGPAPAK